MKNLVQIGLLLTLLVLGGTCGFMYVEDWGFLDSLYMAVITITTVGYEEVHPLSHSGRIFVIAYLIVGLGLFFYGVVQIGEHVLRAELGDWWERRKMERTIKTLRDHYIICGAGRMGRVLSGQLRENGLPFVMVDIDEAAIERAVKEGWLSMRGDATDDHTLRDAGIERARGLAAVLPQDSDNIYVVLSARLISPQIQIIARAADEKAVAKLQKAGANRVVSLYSAAAAKMANFLIHPHVDQFLEVIGSERRELELAEIQIVSDSPYRGKTLAETDFTRRGIIIVGIRRPGGDLLLPPPSSAPIDAGDHLIALGRSEVIEELSNV